MSQPVADADEAERPRVGRPPRISRAMIAEAAHELGLEGLTLKAVAEHLDVSVAALYHHVSGKDDLMRLAAEVSMRAVPLPEARDQHWALWLLEWARYNRDVFRSQPTLLAQYLDGAIPTDVIAERTDLILSVMVRHGFEPDEALAAYELVSWCAIGAAAAALREQAAEAQGLSTAQEYRRVLADLPRNALPNLRMLLRGAPGHRGDPFHEKVTTLLAGIAARRGDDWTDVEARLREAAPARRR